jgi:Rha family phage regulatory protein
MNLVFKQLGMNVTTSRLVANKFGKQHKNVIQRIENLECSEEFNRLNFQPVDYVDNKGEKRPEYYITRDGFTFLVMGFTGKRAAKFKEEYINAFNQMERQLKDHQKQLSPAELMLQQAHMLVDIERRQTETEKKLKELDARTATRPDYYYTATGYGIYVGRRISYSEAVRIGKRASQLCREAGLTIDRVRDSKYAWVGSYPEHILKRVFKEVLGYPSI